jgi:hypothetical protein
MSTSPLMVSQALQKVGFGGPQRATVSRPLVPEAAPGQDPNKPPTGTPGSSGQIPTGGSPTEPVYIRKASNRLAASPDDELSAGKASRVLV